MFNKAKLLVLFAYPMSTLSASSTLASQLDAYLQRCTELGYLSGSVLVAHQGQIVLNKGYGLSNHAWNSTNTPQTKFRLSSLAKPLIALAIMQLQEQKMLNVQDRLSDYIPDYPQGNQITIHHLLTHTAGIQDYTAMPEFQSFKKLPQILPAVIEQFKHQALSWAPGTKYRFSNSHYALLCFIIERVTGRPYYEYVLEHICKPAGMANTGYDAHAVIVPSRAQGYALDDGQLIHAQYHDVSAVVGLGGFYSTVQDMYAFNQALNTQLLASQESLDGMFTPYVHIGPVEDDIRYGYGWATITLAGHVAKKHIGTIDGFSTAMYRFTHDNSFIVMLSNFQHALTEPMSFDLAAIMYGKSYTMPVAHVPVSLEASACAGYVGTYDLRGAAYTITQEHNQLYYQAPTGDKHALIAESESQFFVKGIPIVIRFVKDEHGVVVQMITSAFGKERILQRVPRPA